MVSMAWEGREPLRDWIYLSVSLCFCVLFSGPSPFLKYPEIHNSDWGESFAQIFLIKLAFLRLKKSVNLHMGWPRGSGACPPTSCPPRTPSRDDSTSQKSQIFQNNSPS